MRYVTIGNGVAGINAANVIRNRDQSSEITIISYEHDHFFSRTALMYVACGQLSERCVEPYERDYYDRMGFKRIRDRVQKLDAANKSLQLESGAIIPYDRLLIASGSVPMTFGWPGIDLDGVGHFVSWNDMNWLKDRSKIAKRAVVIGGGLIGIEAVEVLLKAGVEASFLIRQDHYWPIALDEREGTIIAEHMRYHGCDVRLQTEMTEIIGAGGKVAGVKTNKGVTIQCDIVVIAIGVRPQTDFLKDSAIELDERGGIVVDDNLATNLPDIYAAGDCTSVVWFNNVRRPEQLWYTSRDQGKVTGANMVGDENVYVRGTFYNSAKFLDIEYTTAGLVNFNLEGEQNWFYREPGTNNTIRITYLSDKTVAGFNFLGRRWDHTALVRWIEERRKLDWVLAHLYEANYDEEFMPKLKLVGKEA
jgi:NAD(P)H-nitrite reductase large subunit